MEIDKSQIIYTGIDSLLHLVNKKGKIGMSHAAKVLNVDVPTVEVWADTLEEMGDLISKYGISERSLMSSRYYDTERNSIKTLFWQINPISSKIVEKKEENKAHDLLKKKIKEYIELKTQIQAERARLEQEKMMFREMMESEKRAFNALKKIYDLKIIAGIPVKGDGTDNSGETCTMNPPLQPDNEQKQVLPDQATEFKPEYGNPEAADYAAGK